MIIAQPVENALGDALTWLAQLATGSAAAAIATIALAGLGFAAFFGDLSLARAVRICAGMVILFGAPQIAAALLSFGQVGGSAAMRDARQSAVAEEAPRARSVCWTC